MGVQGLRSASSASKKAYPSWIQEYALGSVEVCAMWKFYKALIRPAAKEFWTATDEVLTAIAILLFILLLLNRKLGEHAMTAWNGISAWWSAIPVGVIVLYRLLRANYEQFAKVKQERDDALNQLSGGDLPPAEEDPKVYLDPLNSEFIARGYMPFRVSNQGQRVNPAQAVNIQRIKNVASIVFDYIDRIDPASSTVIVPTVDGHHLVPHHDILPELRQAWKDAHASGELDSDEFPFTITIHYRDAKQIRFISDVSLKYSPLAEDEAHQHALSAHRMEYPIIKVTNTHIRRLS
jgi:hypothetical protein